MHRNPCRGTSMWSYKGGCSVPASCNRLSMHLHACPVGLMIMHKQPPAQAVLTSPPPWPAQEVVRAQAPHAPVDLQLPHVDLERAKARELKALQVRGRECLMPAVPQHAVQQHGSWVRRPIAVAVPLAAAVRSRGQGWVASLGAHVVPAACQAALKMQPHAIVVASPLSSRAMQCCAVQQPNRTAAMQHRNKCERGHAYEARVHCLPGPGGGAMQAGKRDLANSSVGVSDQGAQPTA